MLLFGVLMKLKYAFLLFVTLINTFIFAGNALNDRPLEVQQRVEQIHKNLLDKTASVHWNYSGWEYYGLMSLDEEKLIDSLVENALLSGRKLVKILEFGAGNFSWPLRKVKYIQTKHLNKGIKFQIVGVTGEISLGSEKIKLLQDEVNSSDIKLQLLEQTELESIDKFLEPDFDLIVTSWTLRHLVDPLGSLYRLFNLLRVDGLLLGDSFSHYLEGDGETINTNFDHLKRLAKIFSLSNADSIFDHSAHQFMVRRLNNLPLNLPITYSNNTATIKIDRHHDQASADAGFFTRHQLNDLVDLTNVKLYFYTLEIKDDLCGDTETKLYYGANDHLLQILIDKELFSGGKGKIINIRESQ